MASKRRKATGGGSSASQPPQFNPDPIAFREDGPQAARYGYLKSRKLVPTRYIDEPSLRNLGLLDDIEWMLNNVGWLNFAKMKYETYERITLEFLSSVKHDVYSGNEVEQGSISFRLFNNEHKLTLADLNKIYGFPVNGMRRLPREFKDWEFWKRITQNAGTYNASSSKATKIGNPCIRYIHRFMSNTIFARGESYGVVRQSELLFIWAMLNPGVKVIDAGSYLIAHMAKIGNSMKGDILIGGLITPIAIHLGYPVTSLQAIDPVHGTSRLDIDLFISMHMIVRDRDGFALKMPGTTTTIPLPNRAATTIHNRANWKTCSFSDIDVSHQPPHTHDSPLPLDYQSPYQNPHQSPYQNPHQDQNPTDHQSPYQNPHQDQNPTDHQTYPNPTPEAFAALQAEVHSMNDMVSAIYNWHLSEYPDTFPPPPRR